MYYFAIFVALLSTFVNSSTQLQLDKTRAAHERTNPCETRYKNQNGSQQSKSSNYTKELSDAILHDLALKKALASLAKTKDVARETRSSDAKIPDKSAASQASQIDKIKKEIIEDSKKIPARQPAVENATNGTKKDKGESNDIGKNSKEVSKSEALIPVARLFEDLESSENVNSNRNVNSNKMSRIRKNPKYRSSPNVEPSADVKYNPPPYVKYRMSEFDNVNENVNINSNRNEMSMENKERIKNRRRKRIGDQGNEDLTDGANSDGTETKLPRKIVESATPSGIEDSLKIKDMRALMKTLSTSHEVIASSTTPSSKFVDSTPGSNGSRIKRRRKHRRGKDRSRGNRMKHEKKDQHGPTTESPASLRLKAFEAFRQEIMINKNLTDAILKLLINNEEISALKKQRLKRLLDQLNVDEKRTVLYDLEKEMKPTIDEKTTVKRVVISKSEPKIIVGILARPSQGFQPSDAKDVKIIKLSQKSEIPEIRNQKTLIAQKPLGSLIVNKPRNPNDAEQNKEDVSKKAIRQKSDKSQDPTESPSTKLATVSEARTKETVKKNDEIKEKTLTDRLTSDKVSILDDPKVKAIYEKTLAELRKQISQKNSNVNLNTNDNQNRAKSIRQKSDKSQQLTESPSKKLTTVGEANTKETVKNNDETKEKKLKDRLTSDKVSILNDPKLKAIYDKTLNELRKQFHKNSNVNLNTNDNQNQISDQRRLDRPMPPGPGLDPQLDATKLIKVNLIPSNEDKEFKSRARNHGRYSGISNKDDDEQIKKAAESRPKTNNNPKKINERPPMDSDLVSQDKNLNVNSNLNVNTNADDIKSDTELTRRAAKRRLPYRSNRNRNRNRNVNSNVNVNTNVNNIQAPASEDYYLDGEVWSSRRALDRTISYDEDSNSNSNVNSNVNVNQNVVDRLVNRKVPQRELRKDEVKMSKETVESILREISQLRKQLAEKEAATNLDRKRLWKNVDRRRSIDQSDQ